MDLIWFHEEKPYPDMYDVVRFTYDFTRWESFRAWWHYNSHWTSLSSLAKLRSMLLLKTSGPPKNIFHQLKRLPSNRDSPCFSTTQGTPTAHQQTTIPQAGNELQRTDKKGELAIDSQAVRAGVRSSSSCFMSQCPPYVMEVGLHSHSFFLDEHRMVLTASKNGISSSGRRVSLSPSLASQVATSAWSFHNL